MTTFEKLLSIFKDILPDSKIDYDKVSLESSIKEDLGLTSIGLLYLVLAIEDNFGVEIHNVNIEKFKTVGDVVTYLEDNQ